MEVVKAPSLWDAVRWELSVCLTVNLATSQHAVDEARIFSLHLLQSIYTDVLRLHISFNITREVTTAQQTLGGHLLSQHALVQVPTHLAHQDEGVWGTSERPASESDTSSLQQA